MIPGELFVETGTLSLWKTMSSTPWWKRSACVSSGNGGLSSPKLGAYAGHAHEASHEHG